MTLHWRSDGPDGAPTLVLLNSIGTTTDMWAPLVGALREQFHVVRIDHRGHGGSAPVTTSGTCSVADLAADVVATLDELELDRVHLAGLSLGGMVGMWLAAHRPERVDRLALLCTSAHLPAPTWLDRAQAVRADGMQSVVDSVVARWVTPGLAARDPQLVDELRAMVSSIDAESYAQCCEAIDAMDLRADLARIAAPTIVLAGADDPATPVEHAALIADGIAGAESARRERCGTSRHGRAARCHRAHVARPLPWRRNARRRLRGATCGAR